jgi:fucose permease
MVPMFVGWKCFPERKGMVSSLILTFNSLGKVFASIVSTAIVNPKNLKPSLPDKTSTITYNYYDHDVADNVPWLFRYLGLFAFVLLSIAIFMIWVPKNELAAKKNQAANKKKLGNGTQFKRAMMSH